MIALGDVFWESILECLQTSLEFNDGKVLDINNRK